jgi:glycosyltransferase involved in cell wall biosynthesis
MPLSNKAQEKTHILFIEYGVAFGGAIISASELVNSLTQNYPIQVTVISPLPSHVTQHLFDKAAVLNFSRPLNYTSRFKVETLLSKTKLPKFLQLLVHKAYAVADYVATFVYAVRMFRLIKRHNIQAVHLNNGVELDGVLAAYWAKIPCIVHCRGFYLPLRKRDDWPRVVQNTVNDFIAISAAVKKNHVECEIPENKIHVVHNPVNLSKYEEGRNQRDPIRQQWLVGPGDVVVSIFGRITAWKGQYEFLQAVQKIAPECPNLKIMVVGDSSDDVYGYFEKIRTLANSPELQGKVIFTGYQPYVENYYWASDIVVHNSTEPEPFGRVVIEAMACKRVVVAMNEGGPPEIITNGHDGILLEPRNTIKLANTIKLLYESPQERERLAEGAFTTVAEGFNSSKIAHKVVQIYKKHLITLQQP